MNTNKYEKSGMGYLTL